MLLILMIRVLFLASLTDFTSGRKVESKGRIYKICLWLQTYERLSGVLFISWLLDGMGTFNSILLNIWIVWMFTWIH